MSHFRAARLLTFSAVVAITLTTSMRFAAGARDPGVTWLIFVDDLHLDFSNTGHIRALLRSIAEELIRDGDAFALRSSGPSPSVPFTTNRSLLDRAIGRIAGNALPPAAILRSSTDDERRAEVRERASQTESAARDLLNADPSPTGRRQVMLYVSNGYHLDPDEHAAALAGAAQRLHVIVFAINARALPDAPAQPAPAQADAARWRSYSAAMVDSLRAIAEPTGGFAVLDQTDSADALQRISRKVR